MARERKRPNQGDPQPEEHADAPSDDESQDEDFQFALKELLAAYEPLLAEDLERARQPEALEKEVAANPPSCDDELQLGGRLFDRFFTEEVALRLLPAEGRDQLGPIEQWRWCSATFAAASFSVGSSAVARGRSGRLATTCLGTGSAFARLWVRRRSDGRSPRRSARTSQRSCRRWPAPTSRTWPRSWPPSSSRPVSRTRSPQGGSTATRARRSQLRSSSGC